MRKRLIDLEQKTAERRGTTASDWIDLTDIAEVEISSEAEGYPVEHALGPDPTTEDNTGWRAATPGPQTIRLRFDAPVAIHRIWLHCIERAAERSQEFAIYAGSDDGDLRQVVRQQFTFSPAGSTEEIEDYTVNLENVTVLELRLDPDRAHDPKQSRHYASLAGLRLA
jgi:Anaphase-promoting complex, subunit 10 (APC10)